MLRRFRFVAVTGLLALAALAATAQDKNAGIPSFRDLTYPPLREVTLPAIQTFTLPNGLKVYLVEDHEVPMIQGRAMLRAGGYLDPAGKTGLARLTGNVMRTGGIPKMDGDALDEFLEARAAAVEAELGETEGSAAFQCLTENLDAVLGKFGDVLMRPAFAAGKLDLAKVAVRSEIARRNDEPGQVLRREFRKAIYGADSPYARTPEYADVDAITVDDLKAFHAAWVRPQNTVLAVWGDFNAAAMRAQLTRLFGAWQKGGPALPALPQPTDPGPGGVRYIERTDVNQSALRLGQLGVTDKHPDKVALDVMSQVLGNGFSSRLVKEVRTRQGLAYSVYGTMLTTPDHPGLFLAGCETKLETTGQAISSILGEIKRMREETVPAEELKRAKDAMLNTWVFNFENTGSIITTQMANDFHGLPSNWLQEYKVRVEKVTAEDVLRVAKSHLDPDRFTLVVVGNAAGFDKPLDTFGKVTPVDITIPEPAKAALSTDAGAASRGVAMMETALAAHGGRDAWMAVKTVKSVGTFRQGPMNMGATVYETYPDKSAMVLSTPMGDVKIVQNGMQVAQVSAMGNQKQAIDERTWSGQRLTEPNWLLLHFKDEGMVCVTEGEAVVVENRFGDRVRLTFDAAGRIASMATTEQGQEVVRSLTDYRNVNGVWMNFATTITMGGNEVGGGTMTSCEVNVPIEESMYAIPEN